MLKPTVPTLAELRMIYPVLVPVATLALVLINSMMATKETARRTLPLIAIVGMGISAVASISMLSELDVRSVSVLMGTLVVDRLSLFAALFVAATLIGVIVLVTFLHRTHPVEWPIYLSLMIGSAVGMMLLAATYHLIMFVIAVELASLSSYVLVGFRRHNREAAEGATKYVIFGAVASALMLYGMSLLFGLTGSFDVNVIARNLPGGLATMVGLGCLFIGLGFKISLVPMHFWCPDAFEAAHSDIAAWLSIASKSAALIALARFVQVFGAAGDGFLQPYIFWPIAISAMVTMTAANLSAYWQSSVKRLLAYSSIAHAGYIVCGVLIFGTADGLSAIVAYVLVYLLMNLGAFSVVGIIEESAGSDDISQFRGLGSRSPAMAVLMMVFLFSLVGLPPLAGFAAKWLLLSALWQAGSTGLVVLVVFILANTVLSLFYYMRLARAMYFEESTLPAVKVDAGALGLVGLCATGLLVVFVGWGVLNAFSTFVTRNMW